MLSSLWVQCYNPSALCPPAIVLLCLLHAAYGQTVEPDVLTQDYLWEPVEDPNQGPNADSGEELWARDDCVCVYSFFILIYFFLPFFYVLFCSACELDRGSCSCCHTVREVHRLRTYFNTSLNELDVLYSQTVQSFSNMKGEGQTRGSHEAGQSADLEEGKCTLSCSQ